MIRLANPAQSLPRELLAARGGFAWWYLDLLDASGDGVVIIFAFGLPFLPGYASSDRREAAPAAGTRASVNVVVYKGGEQAYYHLFEVEDAEWSPDGEGARMGASSFVTRRVGERREVEVRLDLPVPGSEARLTGLVRAEGPAVRIAEAGDPGFAHQWSPLLTAATGRARIAIGDEELLHTAGRVYHDRNGSARALHRLGIDRWLWGRCPFPGKEVVFYLLWPEGGGAPTCWWLEVGVDGAGGLQAGRVEELRLGGAGWFGLPRWGSVSLGLPGDADVAIRFASQLEDGPFYQRYAVRVTLGDGSEADGVAETVYPGRVDSPWLRPLVRMAVHNEAGPNSWWLPLFVGQRAGRWQRLGRWWGLPTGAARIVAKPASERPL